MASLRPIFGLLIEDSPSDALIILDMLRQREAGFPALTFAHSADLKGADAALTGGGLDIILLDLSLPDSQGLDTLTKVRAVAPEIPTVVLTGLRDQGLGLQAVMRGAQDYLVKGEVDARGLRRTVRYAVERNRLFKRFQSALETAPDGMVVLDSGDRVRYANSAAQSLLGRSADQLIARPFPYALPRGGFGEIALPAEAGGRIVEVRLSELEWAEEPARLASLRDITALRRVEQLKAEVRERRRVDQLKDAFITTVTHEIRSPLTVIAATAECLHSEFRDLMSAGQREMALLQQESISRVKRIIGRILELSRLESGKARIEARPVDPGELVRGVVAGFQLLAGNQGIRIDLDLPSDLPAIRADPDLVAQVVSNLLDNALRFARGRIEVSARARPCPLTGGRVEVAVSDDGPGIPPDRAPDIFDKFVQARRSPEATGYQGTGLGLAICREIIERQGGRIWLDQEPAKGAVFRFFIPMAAESAAEKQPQESKR